MENGGNWQRLESGMDEMLTMLTTTYESFTSRERDAMRLGLHLGHWEEAAAFMEQPRAMSHWRKVIELMKGLAA